MSRAATLQECMTTATDLVLQAAAEGSDTDRAAFAGHAVTALGEIGMSALAEAMTADADAESDALGSAMAWSRARGLLQAVETLARHIAPQQDTEFPTA